MNKWTIWEMYSLGQRSKNVVSENQFALEVFSMFPVRYVADGLAPSKKWNVQIASDSCNYLYTRNLV